MLIRIQTLKRIKSGEISLVFRRWRKPTVKTGGTLKTAVGVLAIKSVEKTTQRKITDADAKRAGYSGKSELLKEFAGRQGDVYKIKLAYLGDDPRIELRNKNKLTDSEFAEIQKRLERMDSASRAGKWTAQMLNAIKQNPKLSASKLAAKTGFDKDWLKINVRKLKNLGLTISHHPTGYTLSPRGEAFLARGQRKS